MNHTDRKLLELAAKAAGWTVVRWTDDDTALLLEGIQEPFNALHENPHSDCMGDALRLAVKLRIPLSFPNKQTAKCTPENKFGVEGWINAGRYWDTTDSMFYPFSEKYKPNPYAAIRRAIVRAAAAEIAKAGGAV